MKCRIAVLFTVALAASFQVATDIGHSRVLN